MNNCKSFFDVYAKSLCDNLNVKVVEIGSQDVNGSLRSVCPASFEYIGADFESAKGVDVVLDDPYCLPFEDQSCDVVLSSSCFEHSEMFWLLYLEILRILKPTGLFYLNAPSAGSFHRYPVDCWRFFPDSGEALVRWGKRNGYASTILESYTQIGGNWQDYVCIFLKNEAYASNYNDRVLSHKPDYENGRIYGTNGFLKPSFLSQNEKKLRTISQIATEQLVLQS